MLPGGACLAGCLMAQARQRGRWQHNSSSWCLARFAPLCCFNTGWFPPADRPCSAASPPRPAPQAATPCTSCLTAASCAASTWTTTTGGTGASACLAGAGSSRSCHAAQPSSLAALAAPRRLHPPLLLAGAPPWCALSGFHLGCGSRMQGHGPQPLV
jgi:hypothetical protein